MKRIQHIIYLYLIYILLLLIPKIISFPDIAVIQFKELNPSNVKFTPLDYYKSYHLSNIYIELEVGNTTQNQILSLFLYLDDYIFYIDDNFDSYNLNNNICGYSTQLSTYFKVSNSDSIIAGKTSFYGSDYFKIYTDLTKDKSDLIKMEFLYYEGDSKSISFSCSKVVILFPYGKKGDLWKRNFLNQINSRINSTDYSFTIKYEKDNKGIETINSGLFIIGIESYEKNIKKNELITVYNKPDKYCNKQKWMFEIDRIYINNKYFLYGDIDIIINIKSDIEGLEFPIFMLDKLNELYFDKYYGNNICKKEIIDKSLSLIIIYCYEENFEEKDIRNFPEISLLKYKLGFNFTFNGEELFYKKDHKYFFKIIFNSKSYKNDIILGRFFLKKYPVIFNPDSNYMSFYKIEKINKENSNNIKNKNSFLLFRYIILSFIFLIIGMLLGRKFCNIRKNKSAKELVDDNNFIGELNSKEIKKENKLIDF